MIDLNQIAIYIICVVLRLLAIRKSGRMYRAYIACVSRCDADWKLRDKLVTSASG